MRYSSKNPEEKIQKLESELWIARETILHLMPDKLCVLLNSYSDCKSKEETRQWMGAVIEKLLTHVNTDPFDSRRDRSRAFCPLCGSGIQDRDEEKGFAIPEGLRRHFTGYGNMRMCPVIGQIGPHAKEYWKEMFAEQEQIEKEKMAAILKARREKETLYQVRPDAVPNLIDKVSFAWNPCRDENELKWAEDRLEDLGFKRIVKDRIVSYIFDDGEICVYADPLQQKRIEFCAYKIPLKQRSNKSCHHYTLPDYYKNKLKEKIENFILEAKNK